MQLVAAKEKDKRVYEIYIGGVIGEEVNGTYIEADILFLNKNKAADRIDIKINSEGGGVVNGVRIISAILNSKIPIHTYNLGFAMSMGGFIWLSARKENRHMSEFARLMLHAPRFVDESGNIVEPENEDDKIYLDSIKNMLSQIAVGSTGKSENKIAEILSKDSFYDAKGCMDNGFILKNNIISFSQHPQFMETESIESKINKIAAFYKEQETDNQNLIRMKVIAAKLKLNSEASENAIVEKIDSIVAERDEAMNDFKELQDENNKNIQELSKIEKEKKELESKLKEYEEKEKKAKEELATAEVEASIKEGFFKNDEETKKSLSALAINDINSFRNLKKSINREVKAPDLNALLTSSPDSGQLSKIAAQHGLKAEELTYENLWKNHPSVLEAVKNEHPKVHEALELQFTKTV